MKTHPKQRAKGRARRLSARKYAQLLDETAEEIGIAIAYAFLRGQDNTHAITGKREDYACARAVFGRIGIAAPKGRARK